MLFDYVLSARIWIYYHFKKPDTDDNREIYYLAVGFIYCKCRFIKV